ncbi:MAG: alpha/beta fold hydrolase [Deltaproteobacteria bacterium]|nr:alpha/beta fold hydrolase [Deltaproteobacteria bacterium]
MSSGLDRTGALSRIKAEYPFSSSFLEVDGGRLHFLDEGPRNAPAVLMLHGNPTWSFYYRHLVTAFRARYRVVVPDHLGCGLSDKPQGHSYRLDDRIRHVESLASHLGLDRVTVVVHDWGGPIGMGYAQRNLQRARGFVVFNTSAFPSARIPPSIDVCRIPGFGALAIRGANAFVRAALIRAVGHPERLTQEVRDGYLLPYDSWKSRVALLRFVQDIPMSRSHPSHRTMEEIGEGLLRLRDKPMLVVWGAKDFCFDLEFHREWMARFPNAESHVLEDASHWVVEDAYERIIPWMSALLERANR